MKSTGALDPGGVAAASGGTGEAFRVLVAGWRELHKEEAEASQREVVREALVKENSDGHGMLKGDLEGVLKGPSIMMCLH